MRLVQGLAIGALVAFELTVVGMIAMPRVAPDYHAFFIERRSECWPYDVSGAIEPGQRLSFLETDADTASSAVLRCGWIPQSTGAWSHGPESRLLLQVASGRPATIDMEVLPVSDRQRVAITVNRTPLTEWELTKDSPPRQTMQLPPPPTAS